MQSAGSFIPERIVWHQNAFYMLRLGSNFNPPHGDVLLGRLPTTPETTMAEYVEAKLPFANPGHFWSPVMVSTEEGVAIGWGYGANEFHLIRNDALPWSDYDARWIDGGPIAIYPRALGDWGPAGLVVGYENAVNGEYGFRYSSLRIP